MKLSDKINQIIVIDGKAYNKEVRYVYSNGGVISGTVNHICLNLRMIYSDGVWREKLLPVKGIKTS